MVSPAGGDEFSVEALEAGVERTAFRCGAPEPDEYLRTRAAQDARRRVATCFVLLSATREPVGYYTLAQLGVQLGDLPANVMKRLPRYPIIPATLVGRLAVDQRWKGRGLGEHLLLDALHRSFFASLEVASFAVVVEARDESAATFYARFDLASLTSDGLRLFLPMATAAQLFRP